jgi:hypothetical protein
MNAVPEVYVNFSIRLPDRDRVLQELRRLGRTAFVTPAQGDYVVACDEAPELGRKPLEDVAAAYAVALSVPIFAAVRDRGVFCFWLVEGKKVTASYESVEIEEHVDPDDEEEIAAVIADRKWAARHISDVLAGASVVASVEAILLRPERFTSPVKQHCALVEALGLPPWSIGFGYRGVTAGYLPAGLATDEVVRVG